jgi:hypothetical protein
MKPGLITEKLACAARTDTTDARYWETESPGTSEVAVPPQERPCELFEGGLGI